MTTIFDVPNVRAYLHPLVIISTPHEGQVEGSLWVALPQVTGTPEKDARYAPMFSEDRSVAISWWADSGNTDRIGAGDTPNDAFSDILSKSFPEYEEQTELSDEEFKAIVIDDNRQAALDAAAILTEFRFDTEGAKDDLTNTIELMLGIQKEWEERGFGYDDNAWMNVTVVIMQVLDTLINSTNDPKDTFAQLLGRLQEYADR